ISGEFNVRSAYKLLQRSTDNPRAYALQIIYRKFYKKIWSLNIPTKIKIIIWRLSWNYLPTKVNLQHRKLTVNTRCPRCGEVAETMNHLFRECPVTVEVWRALSLQNIMMFQSENKRVHEGKVSNGKEVARFVNNYIIELTGFEKRDSKIIKENKRWKYPQWEFIKINFDGAYNQNQNRSATVVVARDSEGKILLSCSEIHNEISSAFAAGAIACQKAVQVGVEKGWQSLVFYRDSLTIIKKCSTKGQDRSMVGAYIYDIQQKIQGLNNIRFLHTPRSTNNLAHILAIETLRRGEEIYLEMGVPEYAEDQARHDEMSEPV
ncbi:hypothetical protein Golob_024235, partial [Gossypium lobatum]|nr:hypothetical protein [Gossypium lobatum]